MKKLIYILVLLAVPFLAAAQSYQMLPNFYRPLDPSAIQQAGQERNDQVDFNMTVGTGFSSFGGQSAMNSWVAPSVGYQVNPNLRVQFTGILAHTNNLSLGSSPAPQRGMMPLNTGSNSYAISGEGIYQPNDKFYIRAGGQYADRSMRPFQLYPQSHSGSSGYKSLHFGMGYKLSENSSIQFKMQFSDGYNPYGNPYMNSYASPYAPQTPFSSSYRPFPW